MVSFNENKKWNNPNVPRYDFNPERARALLAEIGMQQTNADGVLRDADGHALEILFISNFGNVLREKTAVMIQEDLKKIASNWCICRCLSRSSEAKSIAPFDYECALMGLGGGGIDPARQINVLCSSERAAPMVSFPESPGDGLEARIDALMNVQMRTLEFPERKKASMKCKPFWPRSCR